MSNENLLNELDELESRRALLLNKTDALHQTIWKMLDEKVFQKYPFVKSVGWTQYTPYFNDGDPCHFSVHMDPEYIYVNDISTYDAEDYSTEDLFEEVGCSLPDLEKVAEDIYITLKDISESVMESVYGEGLVTISRDGSYETSDYSHD